MTPQPINPVGVGLNLSPEVEDPLSVGKADFEPKPVHLDSVAILDDKASMLRLATTANLESVAISSR